MKDKLRERIYNIIIKNSPISEDLQLLQSDGKIKLEQELGYNSIDFISLLTELEQEFEVEIPDELLLNDVLSTPDDICETICALKE